MRGLFPSVSSLYIIALIDCLLAQRSRSFLHIELVLLDALDITLFDCIVFLTGASRSRPQSRAVNIRKA